MFEGVVILSMLYNNMISRKLKNYDQLKKDPKSMVNFHNRKK